MTVHHLTLSNDDLLAEYVTLDDLKGWSQQRVAVDPSLMAMIIRNGEVVSASPGGNIGVGGFWRSIKDGIIGQSALRMLIADLKPFQLISAINAVTRDSVQITGEMALEVQINPEDSSGVLGLMQQHREVFKDEILTRMVTHLGDRVIENVIGQMDAVDLRGNRMVQDKIQAEVLKEVERILGDMSVLVNSVSLRWALNDEEASAIEERNLERETRLAALRQNSLHAALKLEADDTVFRIGNEADVEKAKAATEDELRTMVLNQEFAFETARETGLRAAELQAIEHELLLQRKERVATLEAQMDTAQGDIEKAKLVNALREVQRETEMLDHEHALAMKRLVSDQDIELEEQKLILAGKAQSQQASALERIKGIEQDEADRVHGRDKENRQLDQQDRDSARQHDLEKLKVMGQMAPDVALAVQAGASPEVAQILAARAASEASGTAEKNNLMQQMIDIVKQQNVQTAEQARHALETAMQGAVGVAHGASSAAKPENAGSGASPSCRNCGRPLASASAKFCSHCGQALV